MKSWDLWDTLISRRVTNPDEIFQIIEIYFNAPNFKSKRILAEKRARSGQNEEITIDEVYEFIDFPTEERNRLKILEMDLEKKFSYPIKENTMALCKDDIIISDMYLPKEHVIAVLKHCQIDIPDDKIYLSSVTKNTKRTGSSYILAKKENQIEIHIGDNRKSDIDQAKKNGLRTYHYKESQNRTRVEKHWHNLGVEGMLISGVLRAARLSRPKGYESTRWNVYAQVVSPLLIAFCEDLLDKAASKGIERLYFLARDGQILSKITHILAEEKCIGIDCVYMFASRQALHVPGYNGIDEAESWILDRPHPISLKRISDRTEVPIDELLNIATSIFQSSLSSESELSIQDLRKIVRNENFLLKMQVVSNERLMACQQYFDEIGLASDWKNGVNVGFVDVGWRCRLQRSLDSICEKMGYNPDNSIGFYFGIHNSVYSDGKRSYGFLYDQHKPEISKLKNFRHFDLLEYFLKADHPQVLNYSKEESKSVKFSCMDSDEVSKVKRDQEALLSTLQHYIIQKRSFPEIDIRKNDAYIAPFRELVENPTENDVIAFLGDAHSSEQNSREEYSLIAKVRRRDIFKRKLSGHWPEASFKLKKMLWALKLRGVAEKLLLSLKPRE